MKTHRMIGIMSGTSLDGVDLICVDLNFNQDEIQWHILATHCYEYTSDWRQSLGQAHQLSSPALMQLNARYGVFLGERVNDFIRENRLKNIDGVASHGHTVFHQPEKRFTFQIGDGAHIQAITELCVISDFRSQDVALGGQGAPLVPIGDKLLFSAYDACVNLGGFANISYDNEKDERIAFDICPVNFVLNGLCQKIGKNFDFNGEMAKNGLIDIDLLNKLNQLPFYTKSTPKSLGREWVEKSVDPILNKSPISIQNKIATFTHHAGIQIAEILLKNDLKKVLFSGGGAKNKTLVEIIQQYATSEIILLDSEITDFKEALVFALLGSLRLQNKINVLSSVTGAKRDSCSGIVYH